MPKYLKTAFVRDLEKQVMKGELSYTRMLESIQYEVINNYMSKIKRPPTFSALRKIIVSMQMESVMQNP